MSLSNGTVISTWLNRSRSMPTRAKFPAKIQNGGYAVFVFVSELVDDFALTNDILEDNEDDMVVLAAVSCYKRRKLTRRHDYFEATIPRYLPEEFKKHFRMQEKRANFSAKK